MKPIFQEFICLECGKIHMLKVENICVDCRDKKILNEILQEENIIVNKSIIT